jgi:hypothetical protein
MQSSQDIEKRSKGVQHRRRDRGRKRDQRKIRSEEVN